MTGFRRSEESASAEFAHENHVFVLHGRNVEYCDAATAWKSHRTHVTRVAVYVEPPDREGRTEFRFQPLDVPSSAINLKLPPDQAEPMRHFVAAMTTARDDPAATTS